MTNTGRRFFWKLLTTALVAAIGFLTQTFLMRHLGAEQYGSVAFLQMHFEQFFTVLDFGIATAGFSIMSRIHEDSVSWRIGGIIQFWVSVCILLALFYILILYLLNMQDLVWPHLSLRLVTTSAIALGLSVLFARQQSVFDAQMRSLEFEHLRLGKACVVLTAVIVIEYFGQTSPSSYFTGVAAVTFTFCAYVMLFMQPENWEFRQRISLNVIKRDTEEIIRLAKPLAVYTILSGTNIILERWILQISAGSREHGYVAAASQVTMAIFLISGAFVPIFSVEVAKALANNNLERARALLLREGRVFFTLTALIAFCCSFSSRSLMVILGGRDFKDSAFVASILFIAPIHQVYGQIWSSVATVSGRTALYAKIGLFGIGITLPMTYFLVGSTSWKISGLGLGSVGYGVRGVLGQLFTVYFLIFCMSPAFKLSRKEIIRDDFKSLTLTFLCAGVGFYTSDLIVSKSEHAQIIINREILHPVLTGLFALILYIFLCIKAPKLLGLPSSTAPALRGILLRIINELRFRAK
jgi:O-antigen/teichoic acid export membrane protein